MRLQPNQKKRPLQLVLVLGLAVMLVLTLVSTALAAVWTDKSDYSPGSVVTISGDNSDNAGYQSGETVNVAVQGPNSTSYSCNATVDVSGAWSCQITLVSDSTAVGSYTYTATGQTSKVSQSGTFTDAAADHVDFATTGLPSGVSITVNWSETNNGGNPVTDSTTFSSPGPSVTNNPSPKAGTTFTYSGFPSNLTVSGQNCTLSSTSPSSGFTTGSAGSTTHVVATYSCAVANSPPTVSDISGAITVNEGDTSSYSVTASDADSDPLTYAWSVVSGNASISGASDGSSASVKFTDGPSTVKLQVVVDDGHGHQVTKQLTITENNVKPAVGSLTIGAATGTACLTGNNVTLDFSFTDPGLVDYPWAVDINWGDGSPHTTYNTNIQGAQPQASHLYGVGSFTITVSVTDKDGDSGSNSSSPGAVSHLYAMSGILQPFKADGSSVWKYGSTIPVKVTITDCSGAPVAGLAPQVGTSLVSSNDPTLAINTVDSTSAADTSGIMRYDPTAGQYIYNFGTKNLTDPSATYYMTVKGTDTDGHIVTSPGMVQVQFMLKTK